jgi:hypothetical protein
MMTDVHLLLLLLLLLFTKCYLTRWKDNNLRKSSSCPRATTNRCEYFELHLSKYFYHPHGGIDLVIMKLQEYQNLIYVNLRSVNLPATMNNKISHVAKGLVDDLIKWYETGEISRLEFISKVSDRYECPQCSLLATRVRCRPVSETVSCTLNFCCEDGIFFWKRYWKLEVSLRYWI